MTLPRLSVSSTPAGRPDDVVVIGATTSNGVSAVFATAAFASLGAQLTAIGFGGGRDELVRLPAAEGGPVMAVIGMPASPDADALRHAAGSAVRQLAGVGSVTIAFPITSAEDTAAVLEGAAMGAYSYTTYRSASLASVKDPVASVTVLSPVENPDELVAHAIVVAESAALVKDLVNMPPSDLYPATLADAAIAQTSDLPIEVTVWDEDALREGGFGGILGVGQGSSRGPRLVKVEYSPVGASRHLALVGKGITFDTGGLSIKSGPGMVGMKYDMTGAATVLAVARAAALLALPIRITAWLCVAENMVSGTAMRPNDVIRIRGGRTVEVLNTDAEGRLVLADGLAAASEEHPDAIVDVATLTGAAAVALGNRYAAVMGDDDLVAQVRAAASATGELVWPMPLPGELRATINSDVADIANANIGVPQGGALLAGVFLQEFVGPQSADDGAPRIPWAHLDIAGPAKGPSSPYGFTGKGPTAVTVRALIRFAEDFSRG